MFLAQAQRGVDAKGTFSVALSGGSTPKGVFALLSEPPYRDNVPWAQTRFFWGDERHVPPDNPESNFHMAEQALLSKVPVPAGNVHRVHSELPDTGQAALEYEATLRQFFCLKPGEMPRFDLSFLGMGSDGHTASLFPGTKALGEQQRLVVPNWVPKLNTWRITLTYPVLNNAATVVFLVSGAEKADTLRSVLNGEFDPQRYPSQLIKPVHGSLLWLVDRAAARLLDDRS